MVRSRFCLELPGDVERTARPFDAVHHGCIPVLLRSGDGEEMPFEEDLKWSSFSLSYHVRVLQQGDRLLRLLRAIPEERISHLYERGRAVRPYLSVDERCERHPSAFTLVLRQLGRQLDA